MHIRKADTQDEAIRIGTAADALLSGHPILAGAAMAEIFEGSREFLDLVVVSEHEGQPYRTAENRVSEASLRRGRLAGGFRVRSLGKEPHRLRRVAAA